MTGFSAFHVSTLGMLAQSRNLNTIGQNISNVTTNGYKRVETRFETVLSESVAPGNEFRRNQDMGGVKTYTSNTVDVQGLLSQTGRALDLGIAGDGYFTLNSAIDGTGQTYYGRDGSFQLISGDTATVTDPYDATSTIDITTAYLADKNGYAVMGYPIGSDGVVDTSGTPAAMRLDQFTFTEIGEETTSVDIDMNLTASDTTGETFNYQINVVDSSFNPRTIDLAFINAAGDNSWHVTSAADNATTLTLGTKAAYANSTGTERSAVFSNANSSVSVAPNFFNGLQTGDTFTATGTTSNDGTYTITSVSDDGSTVFLDAPAFTDETTATNITFGGTVTEPMTFTSSGTLTSPTTYDLSVAWDDGATSTVTIDVGGFTQFAGDFTVFSNNTDGFEASELESFNFDAAGQIIGRFNNGQARALYQLPLSLFSNPNGLAAHNGNVYAETTDSGEPLVRTASQTDAFSFNPNTVELSNVDLADEMTRMIVAQSAYNSNAMVFKTADQMTEVARDLKR